MSARDCYECNDSDRGDLYEVCNLCEFFVEQNEDDEGPEFIHVDDGEVIHDHDAVPSDDRRLLHDWMIEYPLRFVMYPDHRIGPNSQHYVPNGVMEVRR